MEIFVGADYRGFELKKRILSFLAKENREVTDIGTYDDNENDYNDPAITAAKAVRRSRGSFGILVCDSAHGMTIQANRYKGVRAAHCYDEESAKMAREHEDANILCLSAHFMDEEKAKKIIETFLETNFEPIERRVRRINRLDERGDYD